MKKIIISNADAVHIEDLPEHNPVFAKKHDNLRGMIVRNKNGWILMIGGANACDGYHSTRKQAMQSAATHGYEFFTP